MKVDFGEGTSEWGPGVAIELTGDEVAIAIDAWLVAQGVHVSGPRTVTVNGGLCKKGRVYVDPSGFVNAEGRRFSGRGPGAPSKSSSAAPAPATKQASASGTTVDEIKALERDVDQAAEHLRFHLKGIRHASAHPIVREISNLIDAKFALAAATKSSNEAAVTAALEGLVEACSGEVEEVFEGEIGEALDNARSILGITPTTDEDED